MTQSSSTLPEERLCGLSQRKKGQAFCVDGEGVTVWLSPPRFADHASIVATPDALLYLLSDATLVALEGSGSTYRELARYTLDDSETWAHPAYYAKVAEPWWTMGLLYGVTMMLEYGIYLWLPAIAYGIWSQCRAGRWYLR